MANFKKIDKVYIEESTNQMRIVPILLDIDKILYYEPYIGIPNITIVHLSNGDIININFKFEDL